MEAKTREIQICFLDKVMLILASGQLREEAKKRSDGPKDAVGTRLITIIGVLEVAGSRGWQ